MGKDKKTPITIDEKEYIFEDMTDEQKQLVNHVTDLDRKVTGSQFNLEQLQFGRQAFIEKLKGSLDSIMILPVKEKYPKGAN